MRTYLFISSYNFAMKCRNFCRKKAQEVDAPALLIFNFIIYDTVTIPDVLAIVCVTSKLFFA